MFKKMGFFYHTQSVPAPRLPYGDCFLLPRQPPQGCAARPGRAEPPYPQGGTTSSGLLCALLSGTAVQVIIPLLIGD